LYHRDSLFMHKHANARKRFDLTSRRTAFELTKRSCVELGKAHANDHADVSRSIIRMYRSAHASTSVSCLSVCG
jgi:hypothetical protein